MMMMMTNLSGQRLDRLQVEVEVQMKIVEVLAMYEQIQHVVALAADLQTDFDPVESCRLKELDCFE